MEWRRVLPRRLTFDGPGYQAGDGVEILVFIDHRQVQVHNQGGIWLLLTNGGNDTARLFTLFAHQDIRRNVGGIGNAGAIRHLEIIQAADKTVVQGRNVNSASTKLICGYHVRAAAVAK